MGKAETLIEHGVPSKNVKALADIYKMVPENLHKDFSAYLVALRELDIHKWNEANPAESVKPTLSKADALATVQKYGRSKAFRQAQKDLTAYQNHLLQELVSEGLITKEAYQAMTPKYPNCVPFFREIGEAENLFGGNRKGFINVSAPIKSMTGNTKDIIDPMESIIKNCG